MAFTRKFYVSDTHFGHEAIIGFSRRPFSSINQMDRVLIETWNSVVTSQDIVYILGDFAFGSADYVASVFHALRGRKILITGNHDVDGDGRTLPQIADLPWDRPPTPVFETSDEGQQIFLSHYAHRVWPSSHRGSFHFYGHSHGNVPDVGLSRDVGVDVDDVLYTPRPFTHLVKRLPGLEAAFS